MKLQLLYPKLITWVWHILPLSAAIKERKVCIKLFAVTLGD